MRKIFDSRADVDIVMPRHVRRSGRSSRSPADGPLVRARGITSGRGGLFVDMMSQPSARASSSRTLRSPPDARDGARREQRAADFPTRCGRCRACGRATGSARVGAILRYLAVRHGVRTLVPPRTPRARAWTPPWTGSSNVRRGAAGRCGPPRGAQRGSPARSRRRAARARRPPRPRQARASGSSTARDRSCRLERPSIADLLVSEVRPRPDRQQRRFSAASSSPGPDSSFDARARSLLSQELS